MSAKVPALKTPAPLFDEKTMEIINATKGPIAENITAIVNTFYPLMFKSHPEVLAFFNLSNQRKAAQQHALANAVLASVSHLTNLPVLESAFKVIAYKHCALGVQPEHYQIVHDSFLAATAQTLGAAVTADVAQAWSKVLLHLAGIFIKMEESIYSDCEKRRGGWRGLKEFVVDEIVVEEPGVKSIYFSPADGSILPQFTPGQYITVCENPTKANHFAPRHYTISHPTKLRITTKLEKTEDFKDGVMSTFLHSLIPGSIIHLRPPMGTFVRNISSNHSNSPEIYISGGIGITPITSMALQAANENKLIAHFHIGPGEALFSETSKAILSKGKNGSFSLHGTREILLQAGAILSALPSLFNLSTAHVFICGPVKIIWGVAQVLEKAGVPRGNIHFEGFGPAIDIFASHPPTEPHTARGCPVAH